MQYLDVANPGVKTLAPYQAGKPIEELERELGITNIIKLASNENHANWIISLATLMLMVSNSNAVSLKNTD